MGKFIYLIKSDNGIYKIGVSSNPNLRLKQLKTGHPCNIIILVTYFSKFPYKLETSLKNRFSIYHVNGEWFNLPLEEEINFNNTCQTIDNHLQFLIENENKFL